MSDQPKDGGPKVSCAFCDEPSVTNLDGDELCKAHADKWVQNEGHAALAARDEEQGT